MSSSARRHFSISVGVVRITALFTIAILGCALLSVIPVEASGPKLDAGGPSLQSEPHGDQPLGSFSGNDIDHINFSNGALDVRLPLFSHSGRGLGHQKFWNYTNKSWVQFHAPQDCNPQVSQCPPPDPGTWMHLDTPSRLSAKEVLLSCGGIAEYYWTNFTYVDDGGTPHLFDAVFNANPPDPSCLHPKLKGYALDGSGMTIDLTQTFNTGAVIVTLKDGTHVASGMPYLTEDNNGNMITPNDNTTTGEEDEVDTLGRNIRHVITALGNGASYEDWIAKDANGNDQTTRIEWTSQTICTNFGFADPQDVCPGNITLVSKIDLPNGTSYQFTYDTGTTPGHYGDLLRIDLPTGGYIRYEHAMDTMDYLNPSREVTKRAVSPDGNAAHEQVWTYSYLNGNPDSNHLTTIVTDPMGNETAHVFLGVNIPAPGTSVYPDEPLELETEVDYYKGPHQTGTLLKTVKTDYEYIALLVQDFTHIVSRPIRTTTILDNGLTSKVETDYDPGPDNNGVISYSRANVIEMREYGYGQGTPGALVRRTDYTYLHNSNSAYATANIVDKVLNTTVYDGAGNIVAQTQNVYDGTTLTSTNPSGSCTAPSGAFNHDYCGFGTGNLIRGNLTAVKHWRNTDGAWLTSTSAYDDLGNVTSSKDPIGNQTTYSYTDSWSGTSCLPASGVTTNAFLTQITDALQHRSQASYYYCPGLTQSKRDENDIRANRSGETFTYDNINRLTQTNFPDGGAAASSYNDTWPNLFVYHSQMQTAGNWVGIDTTWFDQLGRYSGKIDLDPEGYDYSGRSYDALGRVASVSDPAKLGVTQGTTQTQYDALGRVTQVTRQDGSIVQTSYSGNCVTVTDEAQRQRKSCSDALGRLTGVWEDPSGLNYETDYSYDTLGNLIKVTQNGSDSTKARVRRFTYDSLSELLSATNPETGTISYTYDNNGNVSTKTVPQTNQPATSTATTTFSYCYDALNRLVGKGSVNSPNAPLTCPVLNASQWMVFNLYDQGTEGVGHRTSSSDPWTSTNWTYDTMGRVLTVQRSFYSPPAGGNITKTVGYSYDLMGGLTQITYPSGAVVSYSKDTLDRDTAVTDSNNNLHYVQNATYAPDGKIAGFAGAAGVNTITNAFVYNSRLQICRQVASTTGIVPADCKTPTSGSIGNILDFQYDFHLGNADNGNLYSATNNKDTSRSQNYTYDALNRLLTATTSGTNCAAMLPGNSSQTEYWGESFNYDAWGNLTAKNTTMCTAENQPLAVDTTQNKNQLAGYVYDAAGNMIGNGSTTYNYDVDSQLSSSGGIFFAYDGDGNRVAKGTSAAGTIYWYGAGGVLTETDLFGHPQSDYVFFDGSRVARRDLSAANAPVYYYFGNQINSASVITDASGNIKDEADYYPWGGLLPYSSNVSNHYWFTGKERDAETQLDYFGARYYGNSMGRFITPDWSAKAEGVPYADFTDPQTLNLYGYVRDNPITRIDPDGHEGVGQLLEEGLADLVDKGAAEGAKMIAADAAAGAAAAGAAVVGAFYAADTAITNAYVGSKNDQITMDAASSQNQGLKAGYGKGAGEDKSQSDISKERDRTGGGYVDGGENGRSGRQSRLKELADDDKVSSSDRGWLKNEKRQVKNGNRSSLRTPPGKQLAHRRGKEARKGYSYKHSDLQDTDLHKTQHRIERENQ